MSNQPNPSATPLTEYLYNKAGRCGIPVGGTFELSPVCNFACRMCYVRKTPRQVRESERKILTLADWLRIAEEARDAGLLYLLLTGGEPFLWPDFWPLYEKLISMGFLISINTNGSLIDSEALTRLKRMPPRRINLTLYGASDETYRRLCGVDGVFCKVDRAIKGLLDAGICVKLNCSLTPDNARDLPAMVSYAETRKLILDATSYMFPPVRRDPTQTGVNDGRFTPEETAKYRMEVFRLQNGPERYRRYLEDICRGCVEPPGLDEGCVDPTDGRIRCRAGRASFWITWDGWLTPCGMMPEPKVDVLEGPFAECWKTLTEKSAALRLSGVCDKCPNKNVCHPCAAISYAETGTSAGIPTYMCRVTQRMREIAREALSPGTKL